MSDGNKFDITAYAQQRQPNRLPLEEMGNVLLDAMQGTLICLDNNHIIIDVSKTIKRYFGFEQTEILGLSILLFIEDSERDLFSKFLSSTSQLFDMCCVRMMVAITNEYRQVKVHRKKKVNQENIDVHSTTTRHNGSVGTILVLTLDDSSYIDITLFDIYKQEFYTKMNLIGEIIFEDHRGALITGYLPHEILSQSIFNFVYHEDRLVKLHALWKCVTTGASKLQWRFLARDGSLVFLQTEYKLIANHQNHDTIVARHEILSPSQRAQFDELQKAWRHQCAADIKGNSSSFKRITSNDSDSSSVECCISVPSLNMCFSTNKLQSLNVQGNIFDGLKSSHPLTIHDYISILIEHDKYLDNELVNMINNLTSLTSRFKQRNDTDNSDVSMDDRSQIDHPSSLRKKSDSDSIVRGILSNSVKYNHHEKITDDSIHINGNSLQNDAPTSTQQPGQSKSNQVPLTNEAIHQQHMDFIKKYRAAKAKLEGQLEVARIQEANHGGQPSDIIKRNTILNKLSQLENIKNKHLARTYELQRQAQQAGTIPMNNIDQKDLINSLFTATSPQATGFVSMDNNNPATHQPPLYNSSATYYQHQRNSPSAYRPSSLPYDSGQMQPPYQNAHTRVKTPVFDEFLTNPSSSPYLPVNNSSVSIHSYMNVSFQDASNTPPTMTSSPFNHHNTHYPY